MAQRDTAPCITATWCSPVLQPGSAIAALHSWLHALMHTYDWTAHSEAARAVWLASPVGRRYRATQFTMNAPHGHHLTGEEALLAATAVPAARGAPHVSEQSRPGTVRPLAAQGTILAPDAEVQLEFDFSQQEHMGPAIESALRSATRHLMLPMTVSTQGTSVSLLGREATLFPWLCGKHSQRVAAKGVAEPIAALHSRQAVLQDLEDWTALAAMVHAHQAAEAAPFPRRFPPGGAPLHAACMHVLVAPSNGKAMLPSSLCLAAHALNCLLTEPAVLPSSSADTTHLRSGQNTLLRANSDAEAWSTSAADLAGAGAAVAAAGRSGAFSPAPHEGTPVFTEGQDCSETLVQYACAFASHGGDTPAWQQLTAQVCSAYRPRQLPCSPAECC